MSDIIRPGVAHVPTVFPYCSGCLQPVERYVVNDVTSPYYVEFDGQCCGRHQGIRITTDEFMRAWRTGAKVWMVTRPGQYQGVGEMRRQGAPKWVPKPERRYVAVPRKLVTG